MLEEVARILMENGYEVMRVERRAFDLMAKKEDVIFLIKVLANVDSYSEDQARDIRTVCALINAKPILVSAHGRNFVIEDNVVYERSSIPVMNILTFRRFIEEEYIPKVLCRKGKRSIAIDPERMRSVRRKRDLSMNELAKMAGVTKKTIYMLEKKGRGSEKVVSKVEDVLEARISLPVNIAEWDVNAEKRREVEGIEKTVTYALSSKGFECYTLKCAPPTLINLHNSKSVLAGKIVERKPTGKSVEEFRQFSEFCALSKFLVLRKTKSHNYYGIAVFELDELEELPEGEEFLKIIKEKEEMG